MTKTKRLFVMLLICGVLFTICFYIICSFFGINVRRTELALEFIEDMVGNDTGKAFTLLSSEYNGHFHNNIDLFTLAAQVFIDEVFPHQTRQESFSYRLHPDGPLIMKSWEGREYQVTIFIIETNRSRLDILTDMAGLYLKSKTARSRHRNLTVKLIYQDDSWKVKNCIYKNIILEKPDRKKLTRYVKILSFEDVVHYGNLYFDLGFKKDALIFYEDYFNRITEWSDDTIRHISTLADLWLENNDSRGPVLKNYLETIKNSKEKINIILNGYFNEF